MLLNFMKIIPVNFITKKIYSFPDNMKTFRDTEKDDVLETEMNHNFEADMYLEKLEHDNEKVRVKFQVKYKMITNCLSK